VDEQEQDGRLMLEVTWEWIALDKAALDLANTVAVDKGVAHDLLAAPSDYQRWAQAAAQSPELTPDEAAAITAARPRLLALREHTRAVLHATAADQPLPGPAVAALNTASRAAPQWPELGHHRQIEQHARGDAVQRLLAHYARSTMELAAGGSAKLRVCGAPSCGMFYRPRRRQQRWCSEPCGTRARVARHYRAHHSSSSPPPRPG
jgi:predicted RNA-binding Zn ribbon-like protein